jgi:hypothetical protein
MVLASGGPTPACGHEAVALTLPGLADGDSRAGLRLSDAVAHVVSEIEQRDLADVTLVAHSWGGYPSPALHTGCPSASRR